MEASTRLMDLNLEELIQYDKSYITIFHEFGIFLRAKTVEELQDANFKINCIRGEAPDNENMAVPRSEFFISTNEELNSEQVKVLVAVEDTFYHFFIDSLPIILKIHRQDPSVLFVLYLQRARPNPAYEKFLTLMFRILDGIDLKYKTISTIPGSDYANVYQMSNYVVIDTQMNIHEIVSFVDIKYAVDLAMRYCRDGAQEEYNLMPPYRKVYITRGGKGKDVGPIDKDYKYYKDDLRIYEEEKLEKFFSDLGYEILQPEVKFDSIMEQMRYMEEVKTLVSVTSSGLTNMIFMQSNQTIIELQAELVQVLDGPRADGGIIPKQNLHSFYQPLSFMNEHTYISIPSQRDPDKIIETLSQDSLSRIL